eukprot:s1_g1220.t1
MAMTNSYRGACACGTVSVDATLARPIHTYTPRACDCSYCTPHNAAYLSDPEGAAVLHVSDQNSLRREHQGSETATMLLCDTCGSLLGAVCEIEGRLKGAINSRVLECQTDILPAQSVHLSDLDRDTKVKRWSDLWMPFEIELLDS